MTARKRKARSTEVLLIGKAVSIIYKRDGLLFEHKFRGKSFLLTDGRKLVVSGRTLRWTPRGIQD